MRSIASMGLILFGLCAIVNADLVDNFESYALNTWPSSAWTPDGDADGHVALDPTKPSNQVLRLYGVVGSRWATLAYHSQSFPDEFILEASVYNGSEYILGGGHDIRGAIQMRNGTEWWNPARALMLFRGDGTILGSEWDPIGTYSAERWYDVVIQYRRNAHDVSLQYWLDDVYLGAHTYGLAWGSQSTERAFDHIDLSAQAGTAYFDDIKMNVVPLPGAAILGLVGLSLAGWRLRRGAV